MTAYFVTATGTEIGKTYIAAELLKAARAKRMSVSATKPLMSGFSEGELSASDAGRLLTAMGQEVTSASVSEVCLHRFEAPIAPNVAMRTAGVDQNYAAIVKFIQGRLVGDDEFHLVEGAGGLMSPVTDDKLHSDLITDLGLPVILVTTGYLGAVSHTLTALECLKQMKVEVAAVVVSQPTPDAQAPEHLMGEIKRWSDVPVFAVGYGEDASGVFATIF